MRASSTVGAAPIKAIILQVFIGVAVIAWFKLGVPHMQKVDAATQVAKREIRIEDLFRSMVVDASSPGLLGPPAASAPRLREFPSLDEVKRALGPADAFSGDFRGGAHLTWTGNHHRLEAAFNNGRLYCLRREDLQTGHGTLVFESSAQWQAF